MKNKLEKLKKEILNNLEKVQNDSALRDLDIKYLGRKGKFTEILRGISKLSIEEKKKIGKLANEIKNELQLEFSKIKNKISNKNDNIFIDPTLPGKKIDQGHLHPITQIQNDLEYLFSSMGFMVLEGPELESEYYNFEALNIPEYQPARDMHDTFYIDDKDKKNDMVMRTHTSPMQVRAMLKYGAPLKCIISGRTFRCEAIDACHEHTFDQIEGFMIGEDISMSNLIAIIKEMMSGIFERDIKIRVRPGYFPFVEPGIEIDVSCVICNGKGCPSCKHSGWLEMIGAGMIHPNVLNAGNIDSEKYSGFAFGVGLTRLAMMKYGIDDIRLFNSGDLKFLNQF